MPTPGAAWPALLALLLLLLAAAPAPGRADGGDAGDGGLVILRAAPPSATERYCAWFGDARDGVLYFGEAAFWTAFRVHGRDPRADLRATGPQRIGRLDLAREQLLPALDVTTSGARSGVWDVLAHPNGRVYFTTFFESSGWVDPATGANGRFEELGTGLSELALASGGQLVAARYARPGHTHGSVLRFSADGFLQGEYSLRGVGKARVAPKSVAYDPIREEIWALTDLLSPDGEGAVGHDARVLDRFGRERLRLRTPEIQFVSFAPDGTGYLAELDGSRLHLRVLAPGDAKSPHRRGRRILLDAEFPKGFDFVQELHVAGGGRVVATRWSGWVHVVDPAADPPVRTLRLPRIDDEGLYYTGVLHGPRLCATYCSDLVVACRDAVPTPD